MLAQRIFRKVFPKIERSSTYPISAWIKHISKYGLGGNSLPVQGSDWNTEGPPNDFESYARRFYKGNGVIFGVCRVRLSVFSQIHFKWRPKDSINAEHSLRDTKELDILDNPAPGQTTGQFLARAVQDVDLAGNAYWAKEVDAFTGQKRLRRLRPDWVDIVLSAPADQAVESDVIGYIYHPGGYGGPGKPRTYTVEEVAHWAPYPDPEAQYRGMSWMSTVLKDIMIEESANQHRLSFFQRGAQSNIAIVMKEYMDDEQMDLIQARFNATHAGAQNAYAPIFVSAGADIVPIESDLSDLDMSNISGRAETHIAMASGIHPTVASMMEGMQGASLNSGNFQVAERGVVNMVFHHLWGSLCAALEQVVHPPAPTRRKPERMRLWYSTADVAILNDDRLERAQIRNQDAETIDKLVREGWTPDSAKEYVKTGDIDKLEHSGYVSVQLYDPNVPANDAGSNLAPKTTPPSGSAPVPNVDPKSKQAKKDSPQTSEKES